MLLLLCAVLAGRGARGRGERIQSLRPTLCDTGVLIAGHTDLSHKDRTKREFLLFFTDLFRRQPATRKAK